MTLIECVAFKPSSFASTHGLVDLRLVSVNILLVEDHADTSRVISALLTRCGHEVVVAENLRDALHLVQNVRFDVLVSDIGLPDGTGLDLVSEAKKLHPWKKMLAVSALVSDSDRQAGLEAGFDEYLTKPLDFQHLRTALADVQ